MNPAPSVEPARAELERAQAARAAGNEGLARVCARRAAGQALGLYAARHAGLAWGRSALSRLAGLAQARDAPAEVRQAAERLIARITPEHVLPFDEDPLGDARRIVEFVEATASAG
jgi:hypothetical protein